MYSYEEEQHKLALNENLHDEWALRVYCDHLEEEGRNDELLSVRWCIEHARVPNLDRDGLYSWHFAQYIWPSDVSYMPRVFLAYDQSLTAKLYQYAVDALSPFGAAIQDVTWCGCHHGCRRCNQTMTLCHKDPRAVIYLLQAAHEIRMRGQRNSIRGVPAMTLCAGAQALCPKLDAQSMGPLPARLRSQGLLRNPFGSRTRYLITPEGEAYLAVLLSKILETQ